MTDDDRNPPTIEDLSAADEHNLRESLRGLRAWHPPAYGLVDRGMSILADAAHAISNSDALDEIEGPLREWAEANGVSVDQALAKCARIERQPSAAGDPGLADAYRSYLNQHGFQIRVRLFMKLQRDYLLTFGELLRHRAFAAVGYWRTAIETAALVRILHDRPEHSLLWMKTYEGDRGREFFKATREEVKRIREAWKVDQEYDESSGIAQHTRFMTIAPGWLIAHGRGDARDQIGLEFTDIGPHGAVLFLWFYRSLALQHKLMIAFEEMFPDVSGAVFAELPREQFAADLEAMKVALRPQLDAFRALDPQDMFRPKYD